MKQNWFDDNLHRFIEKHDIHSNQEGNITHYLAKYSDYLADKSEKEFEKDKPEAEKEYDPDGYRVKAYCKSCKKYWTTKKKPTATRPSKCKYCGSTKTVTKSAWAVQR